MGKADEAAEHAVPVKPVCEIRMPRTPEDVALVPVCARIGIEPGAQMLAINRGIGARGGLAEELPEFGIVGKGTKPGELELEQREVCLVEVDGVDLRRLRGQIRQRVASAG